MGGNPLNISRFLHFCGEIISVAICKCEAHCLLNSEAMDATSAKTARCDFLFHRKNCINPWVCGIENITKIPRV